MSDSSDLSTEKLMSWVKNGKKETPNSRMAFGGITKGGIVHLKTNEGEVITYSIHNK